MRKSKNQAPPEDLPMSASFMGDSFSKEDPTVEPTPAPVEAKAAPTGPKRNLTAERRVAFLEGKCKSEVDATDEYAVTRGLVHRLDKDGNVVIENGMPVADRREMLTVDVIKSRYAKMIKAAQAGKL